MGSSSLGCAGQLTDAEKELFGRDIEAGVTGGAGGAGGEPPPAARAVSAAPSAREGRPVVPVARAEPQGARAEPRGGAGGGMLDPCMAPIVQAKCALSGCHGGTVIVAGLDLSAAVPCSATAAGRQNQRGLPDGLYSRRRQDHRRPETRTEPPLYEGHGSNLWRANAAERATHASGIELRPQLDQEHPRRRRWRRGGSRWHGRHRRCRARRRARLTSGLTGSRAL